MNVNLLVTEEPPADTEAGVDQVDEGEGGQQQAEVAELLSVTQYARGDMLSVVRAMNVMSYVSKVM